MSKFPAIKGTELKKFCEKLGFKVTRQRGSHVRMKHDDGRVTSIPIHSNRDIPKGLLRKIIREDLEMQPEEFLALYIEHK
jgi:predicted RNA binding protein YcfA (HicA-like mRNA interferase family)